MRAEDWKPGDLCQVRRGKKWVDAEVSLAAMSNGHLRVAVYGSHSRSDFSLHWVSADDLRPRPAPRGKLPEPPTAIHGVEALDMLAHGQVAEGSDLRPAPWKLKPVPKPKTARDSDYLAHVRKHPCCSCGATEAIHAHHVASGGMGQKASDYLTAPLCGVCHQHWHATATLPLGDVNSGMRRLRSAAVLWEAAARCLEEWITREGE